MLAGVPMQADAVAERASVVRTIGADELADRLEGALAGSVALLALTSDEGRSSLQRSRIRPKGSPSSEAFS